MKQSNLLLITTIAMTLTACSSGGSSGGISTTTNPTGGVNGLTQNYTVPTYLKDTVARVKGGYNGYQTPEGKPAIVLGDREYRRGEFVNLSVLPMGYNEQKTIANGKFRTTEMLTKVYHMPYSVALGYVNKKITLNDPNGSASEEPFEYAEVGYHTVKMPDEGKATYTGVAMDALSRGTVQLNVDFKTGATQGTITGLKSGQINLGKGKIHSVIRNYINKDMERVSESVIGFSGDVTITNPNVFRTPVVAGKSNEKEVGAVKTTYSYTYDGEFFGPKAEEVAGGVSEYVKKSTGTEFSRGIVSFGGQRGNIQK